MSTFQKLLAALTPHDLVAWSKNLFAGVSKTIPLYVPGGSINAYKTADGWKDFTNILAIPIASTEFNSPDELSIYPNPARDMVRIAGVSNDAVISVFTLNGNCFS